MGKGIDLAAIDSPQHAAAMDDMKDQLIIVLIQRLGGAVDIPVAEIDDLPRGKLLMMNLDIEARRFHFEVRQKQ